MTNISDSTIQTNQEQFNEHLDQLFFEGYAQWLYLSERDSYVWQLAYYLHEIGVVSCVDEIDTVFRQYMHDIS